MSESQYKFAEFQLDCASFELRRQGRTQKSERISLERIPMELLILLLERQGSVVTRQEIVDRLWGKDVFVDTEHGINTAIRKVRQALKDDSDNPRFVHTVSGKGYRFVTEKHGHAPHVAAVPPEAPQSTAAMKSQPLPPVDTVSQNPTEALTVDTVESTTGTVPSNDLKNGPKWNHIALTTMIVIIAGVVIWAAYRLLSRDRGPNLESIQITKLTDSGNAAEPAISPDGRYVAYVFRNGNDSSLRLRQIAIQGETQVLPHDSLVGWPTFSPDSSHLYFLRPGPNDFYADLYEIPVLGGPERRVASSVSSNISFSPDEQRFAYERAAPSLNSVEIRIANVDGTADRLLVDLKDTVASNYGPAWSPDGRSIAVSSYLRSQLTSVLDVISTANAEVRQLYSNKRGVGTPRWLHDGKMLVVPIAGQQVGHTQLWTVSYPGGESRHLTNDLANYDLHLDTSRNGNMLATVQWTITANLWSSPASAPSTGKQITTGEQRITEIFPFGARIGVVNRADGKLWLMDEDGSHARPVTDAHGAESFIGCASFILFVRDTGLVRLDGDRTNPMQLAAGDVSGEACSPDGKFVYYIEHLTARWKIRRVPINGGIPIDIREIPSEDGPPDGMAFSPDSRLLAFRNGVSKLEVIPITGGQKTRLFDVERDNDRLRWSPDGCCLEYVLNANTNGPANLWEQPLEGGPPRRITKFTSGLIFDFNWTTDGKHLLLSRGDANSDVVLLSNLR